jgi:ATP-dependent Clp protease ATP-binding subunit ClpA
MNRIDKVGVFRFLQEHHLRQILELELQALQDRVMIVRSFVNCPRLRHSSALALLYFQ